MRFHHSSFGSDLYFQLLSFSSFVHSFDKGNLFKPPRLHPFAERSLGSAVDVRFLNIALEFLCSGAVKHSPPTAKVALLTWRFLWFFTWRYQLDLPSFSSESDGMSHGYDMLRCFVHLKIIKLHLGSDISGQELLMESEILPYNSDCVIVRTLILVLLERLHEHLEISNQLGDTCKHIQRTKSYHLKNSTCQLQLSTRFQQH